MKWFLLTIINALTACASFAQPGRDSLPDDALAWRLPGAVTALPDSSLPQRDYSNDVPVSAVRDFMQRFKQSPGARWYIREGGVIAIFDLPGISVHVAYNRKGVWIYTLQFYREKQLSRDIRGMVKSVYYDFSITQVQQIEQYNIDGSVYIIHLQDDAGWKTIRYCNGEMEEVQTFYKNKATKCP